MPPIKEPMMTEAVGAVRISGVERDAALRARVGKLMTGAAERITVRPVRTQAVFFDDNGPKGGRAMRCALTVRLPDRPSTAPSAPTTTAPTGTSPRAPAASASARAASIWLWTRRAVIGAPHRAVDPR